MVLFIDIEKIKGKSDMKEISEFIFEFDECEVSFCSMIGDRFRSYLYVGGWFDFIICLFYIFLFLVRFFNVGIVVFC